MADEGKRTKISVTINHHTYTIVGTESRMHVEQVAKMVDGKMEEIRDVNKHLDTTKLAVLTALNTMNDYMKLKKEHEELLKLLEEDS